MVVALECGQVADLLEILTKYQGSERICGELAHRLRDALCTHVTLVDEWPEVKAVVVRRDSPEKNRVFVDLVAMDLEVLISLLRNPSVIDWSQRITFSSLNTEVERIVQAIVHESNIPYEVQYRRVTFKVTKDALKIRPISDGFRLESLQPQHAEMVLSLSTWSGGEAVVDIICLMENPSLCLYNPKGELVGYVMTRGNGFLIQLYVLEEHRGKGYAKVLVSQLTAELLKSRDYVCVFVQTHNEISLRLHEELGFKLIGTSVWIRCNF